MALTSRLAAKSQPGEYRLQDWPSAGLLLPTMPLLATLSASVLRLLFGAWQVQLGYRDYRYQAAWRR